MKGTAGHETTGVTLRPVRRAEFRTVWAHAVALVKLGLTYGGVDLR